MNTWHDQPLFAEDAQAPGRRRSLPQIIRRRPLAVLCGIVFCLATVGAHLLWNRPMATATAKLCLRPEMPKVLGDVQSPAAQVGIYNYVKTQAALVKSQPIVSKALASLTKRSFRTFRGVDDPAEYLSRNLKVDNSQGDLILTLSLDGPYPTESIELVNAVIDAYIAWHAEQRRAGTAELLGSLESERQKWDSQLEEKRKALADFREANRVPSLDSDRVKTVVQQLSNLEQQLIEARMDTFAATADVDSLRKSLSGPVSISQLPESLQYRPELTAIDRELGELRTSLNEQQMRLMLLSEKYSDRHPTVQAAQGVVDQIKQKIALQENRMVEASLTAATARVKDAKQRESQVQQAIDTQEKALAALQGKAAQYAKLEADLARATRLYDSLDQRIKELDLASEIGPAPANVIEPARLADPAVWSRVSRSLMIAAVLGFLTGCVFAAWRDMNDQTLRSSQQVVDSLGLPVLGVVPKTTRKHAASGHVQVESHTAAAAYGIARTSLELGDNAGAARSVLVASPARGEGCTSVAVNVAATMAQASERVLLIDANFHAGSLHDVFAVNNAAGLSTVLSGNEPVDGLIQETRIAGLDVLPAGPTPENPAGLLGGGRMAELLREMSRRYDRVVIDGPQVSSLPDARILSAMSDATLLVIRANRTSRGAAENAADALVGVGGRVAGVVVHGATARNGDRQDGWCCCSGGGARGNQLTNGGGRLSLMERPAPPAAAA